MQKDGVLGVVGHHEGVVVVLSAHRVAIQVDVCRLALVHNVSYILEGEVKG